MLSATRHGVGHFGHVYTRPEDRRKGAASALMRHLMEDFRRREGRALFLGTGYDSAPFHIYQAEGFRGLEPESGLMDYYVGSGGTFRREWFSIGPVEVGAASWENWPTSVPLFTGPFPGTVRMAPLGMFGRVSTESGWLHLLHDDSKRGRVLIRPETGAIVGAAVAGGHPLWPGHRSARRLLSPRLLGSGHGAVGGPRFARGSLARRQRRRLPGEGGGAGRRGFYGHRWWRHRVSPSMPGKPGWRISRGGKDAGRSQPL